MGEDELDRIIAEALGEGPSGRKGIVIKQLSDGYWYEIDTSVSPSRVTRLEGQPEPIDKGSQPDFFTSGGKRYRATFPAGGIGPPSVQQISPDEAAAVKGTKWTDPRDGSEWMLDEQGNPLRQLSGPIPGYVPGRGVPGPGPLGRQLTAAELEKQQLDVQKAKRDLLADTVRAQQDYYAAMQDIEGQVARSEIDMKQAEELAGYAQQAMQAAMRGTTPWQIDKQKQEQANLDRTFQQTQASNRANLAGRVWGDRMQTGSSLANSLLSGMTSGFGKILSSTNPPYNFDPFLEAKRGMGEIGGPGDAELSALARAVLTGALGGQ